MMIKYLLMHKDLAHLRIFFNIKINIVWVKHTLQQEQNTFLKDQSDQEWHILHSVTLSGFLIWLVSIAHDGSLP